MYLKFGFCLKTNFKMLLMRMTDKHCIWYAVLSTLYISMLWYSLRSAWKASLLFFETELKSNSTGNS